MCGSRDGFFVQVYLLNAMLPNADNNEAAMVELMYYSPNNEKIQVFH